jgi:anti-anti-sigma regulatory factor
MSTQFAPQLMEITTEVRGGIATIALAGAFDFASRRAFKRECARYLAGSQVVTLDIDLAGVAHDVTLPGLLLIVREHARGVGKRMLVRNADAATDAALALTAFYD